MLFSGPLAHWHGPFPPLLPVTNVVACTRYPRLFAGDEAPGSRHWTAAIDDAAVVVTVKIDGTRRGGLGTGTTHAPVLSMEKEQ